MQVKTHNQILSNHTHEENAGGVSFNDLRGFIALLEQAGELKRISAEVDWDLELSHVAKLNEQNGGPALLFENVKDYEWPVFTSALATSQRLALALGLPKETSFTELAKAWVTKVNRLWKIAAI